MNVEFLLLILDYFRIIKRRDLLADWVIPLTLSAVFFYINIENCKVVGTLSSISSNSISLLGVLVGFSIAVITLLVTANTKNIEEIKLVIATTISDYRKISLFELMIITYTYSVVIEIFLIIFNLFIPSLGFDDKTYTITANLIASIDILLILHVLFVTIRNATNFYFVLIKK